MGNDQDSVQPRVRTHCWLYTDPGSEGEKRIRALPSCPPVGWAEWVVICLGDEYHKENGVSRF